MDSNIFNGTFWLSFCGVVAGIIGLVVGVINKSKCREVACCCFRCIRDTNAEVEIEEHRIDHNVPESPTGISTNNLNVSVK